MPNRTIRDGCRSSEALDRLTPEAERMFWRLLTVADDFGRFDARPIVMLVDCFKLMAHQILVEQVSKWFNEMECTGLVKSYIVDDKVYGSVTKWGQKRRSAFAKYPAPPWDETLGPDAVPVQGKLRTEVLTRDGHKCLACLVTTNLSVDHIVSKSLNGMTVIDNLQTLCVSCNSAKRFDTFNLVLMDTAAKAFAEKRRGMSYDQRNMGHVSPEVRGTRNEVRGTRYEERGTRNEEGGGGRMTAQPASDSDFLQTLKNDSTYKGIDIDRELGKCENWLKVNQPGKIVTRKRFINWLNRADSTIQSKSNNRQGGLFLR